ncbi:MULTISPECIES: hypothetical protein [Rhizobium]|uniref:hypothetical protein n=1 Tax=Rhizobium TaxID=379 RepID=UPI00195BA1BA|nr:MULTISPECIES: hypothetical protein [Rhizobium]MBM7046722.1 hypothetical protein [Rhizobium lusitanum]
MQGIELSRGFYNDIVRPWLSKTAPELCYSAALIGYGSELIGFDDEPIAHLIGLSFRKCAASGAIPAIS